MVSRLRNNIHLVMAARNALGLYGLYCGYYLVSLIITPYLARVLGPAEFGRFAVLQGFAMAAALLVEYGFSFSAVSALQRSPERSSASLIVVEVMAAKGVLSATACALLLATAPWIPGLWHTRWLFATCLLAMLSQGFNPSWIYQGYGRLMEYSAFDMATKMAFGCGVFLVVRTRADLPRAALLWAMGAAVSTLCGIIWIGRGFDWAGIPPISDVIRRLREGLSLFGFRMATNLQAAANPLIVSLFESGAPLGAYAGCDKIAKNLTGTLYPAIEAIYPYMANRAKGTGEDDRRRSRFVVAALAAAGASLSVITYWAAPLLIRILLGPAYQDAVTLLRILSPLPLLTAFNHSLGVHYMLPQGFERAYFRITFFSLILHGLAATWLTYAYGARGMCYAQLLTPAITILLMSLTIQRAALCPMPTTSQRFKIPADL